MYFDMENYVICIFFWKDGLFMERNKKTLFQKTKKNYENSKYRVI